MTGPTATACCDTCSNRVAVSSLAAHPADDFPYDWLICSTCRRRDPRELLRSEVGS